MNSKTHFATTETCTDSVSASAPPAGAGHQIDSLELALRHKWLLAFGLLLGLVLGQLGYMKLGPSFEATARILVSKKAAVPIKEGDAKTYGERGEHVALIMSPMIVSKAIEMHHLQELKSLAKSKDPVKDILDDLQVKRSAGTDYSVLNVLDLIYRNPRKQDADAVVTAIIAAYRDYLNETHAENTHELVTLISTAQTDLMTQLSDKRKEYLTFRENSPLYWRNPTGSETTRLDVTNTHRERLDAIEAELCKTMLAQSEVSSKIKAIQQAIGRGESREALDTLVQIFMRAELQTGGTSAVSPSTNEASLDTQLLPLLLQEEKLLREFGPDHPDVQSIQKSVETIRLFYHQRGVRLPDEALDQQTLAGTRRFDPVDVYLKSLQQQLVQLQLRETELKTMAEGEGKLAKQFAHYQEQDQTFNDEISHIKSLWEVVVSRLNQLQLVKDNHGYSMKQVAPVRSEILIKRHIKFLGGGGVLGLAIVSSLVFLREWSDTRLRSVEQIRALLQAPILGSVPQFTTTGSLAADADTTLQPALCYYYHPGSAEAEAYRAVRTALFVSGDAQVIQVTSPEPGDGKTTFISNLALAIAQSGKNVLLIDADLRRPTVHRIFGIAQEVGISDVLNGDIDVLTAVRPTLIPGLSLVTAGTTPQNPAELLASPSFEQLIAATRSEFDYVLIDSPPLLAVTDPCIVSTHADGLVLVIHTDKNTRATARQAHELLEAHGANVLGVVANGVTPSSADGYGYGNPYALYVRSRSPLTRNSSPSHAAAQAPAPVP